MPSHVVPTILITVTTSGYPPSKVTLPVSNRGAPQGPFGHVAVDALVVGPESTYRTRSPCRGEATEVTVAPIMMVSCTSHEWDREGTTEWVTDDIELLRNTAWTRT